MLSVLTPVHPTSLPYLRECAWSLDTQTHRDFEWVILANGGVTTADVLRVVEGMDCNPLVLERDTPPGHGSIGALKRACAEAARGSVLVELDADDMLTPMALQRLAEAFADPDVQFAYSDCVEFMDGSWEPHVYSSYWGWKSYPYVFTDMQGIHRHLQALSCFPSDHNTMRRVEWAPNHVRSWRSESYWAVGGHDAALKTGDDHELVCRTFKAYGQLGVRAISEVLYAYRVHPQNSSRTHNGDVQAQVALNYDAYYFDMAKTWATQRGLRKLDLGGRIDSPGELETVDRLDADITADLEDRWPFEDSSVGVIRAYHVFEHLKSPIHAMNEAYRVLAPGGTLFLEVPSTDGRGAWQDPTHVSFWNLNSLWYYTRDSHARYIRPEYTGRFQLSRAENRDWGNGIVVVRAELICLKDGYRTGGEVLI